MNQADNGNCSYPGVSERFISLGYDHRGLGGILIMNNTMKEIKSSPYFYIYLRLIFQPLESCFKHFVSIIEVICCVEPACSDVGPLLYVTTYSDDIDHDRKIQSHHLNMYIVTFHSILLLFYRLEKLSECCHEFLKVDKVDKLPKLFIL